jgi:hypothetical protein
MLMGKCVTGVYTPLFSVFKTYVILSQKKIGQCSCWTVVFFPLVLRHLVCNKIENFVSLSL